MSAELRARLRTECAGYTAQNLKSETGLGIPAVAYLPHVRIHKDHPIVVAFGAHLKESVCHKDYWVVDGDAFEGYLNEIKAIYADMVLDADFSGVDAAAFPEYTHDNLDIHGVVKMCSETTFYYLPRTHPVVAVLLANKAVLKDFVMASPRIDTYKVDEKVFLKAVERLKATVFMPPEAGGSS